MKFVGNTFKNRFYPRVVAALFHTHNFSTVKLFIALSCIQHIVLTYNGPECWIQLGTAPADLSTLVYCVKTNIVSRVWWWTALLCVWNSDPLILSDPWVGLWRGRPYFMSLLNMFTSQSVWARVNSVGSVEQLRCRQKYKLIEKSSTCTSLPFLRSLSGGRLCVGCRDSSSISWVIASLWGLGNSRLNILQSPSAPSSPWEAGGSIRPRGSGWNWAGSQESFGSMNCPFGLRLTAACMDARNNNIKNRISKKPWSITGYFLLQ